jgi:two-component system chemotaxis response regulator CheB
VAEIPRLLKRLAAEPAETVAIPFGAPAMEKEPIIEPAAQTCPECGGAMREERVGSLVCYRCHIGHVMTAEILAASQLRVIENEISALLRSLNERVGLCRDMAEKHRAEGRDQIADQWQDAAQEAMDREMAVRDLEKRAWLHPESTASAAAEVPEESLRPTLAGGKS